ncbi:hypothetical protein ACKWTF_004314 [Chironomus riparius]
MMEFLSFRANSTISSDLYDIFKSEDVEMDENGCEFDTINPDDFLNESFLNELKTETEDARKSISSESSCSFENISNPQLTPPISPQPIIIDTNVYQKIQIIPIQSLQHNQYSIQPIARQEARKIKPIIPKPSNASSSDSETNQNSLISSKTNSPIDKALIKQARLIRNRESALISRKKKKDYLQNLEIEVNSLRKENDMLKEENSLLKARLKGYSNFTCRCASTITRKLPNRNASLMLALIFMIGFNVIPLFGNIFLSTNSIKKPAAQPSSVFSARHLLYANFTTTANSSVKVDVEDKIPLYFNQTNLIRKANIENIRSWIPQPDLYNGTVNNDQFLADPFQDKLAKMHEKSHHQMLKHSRIKKKPTIKKKVSQERNRNLDNIQFYDTSFFKLHEFFEEINRKEDTFYLFSFKSDHLLLPAIDYPQNFSQIIKMNLIMPRSNNESLSSDKITMMQIETIILNTSLIQITEKSIPGEFKAPYSNSTQTPLCNNESQSRGNLDSFEESKRQPFKRAKFAPYFGPSFDLSPTASIKPRK